MTDISKVDWTLIDSVNTSGKMVSVHIIDADDQLFGYVAGENKTAEAYTLSKEGKLELQKQYQLSDKSGGTRALTKVSIGKSNLLLIGNKADDALEVWKINTDGALEKVNAAYDSEETYIDEIVTIETVQVGDQHFVYAGGLDKGFSCFELLENGDLHHVQSIADTKSIFVHGIIGMSSLVIDNKRFLITGAFFDGGVSSFAIMDDGKLKNIHNVKDDQNLFLNGTFPIHTIQLGSQHYLLVGHRHNIHYTDNDTNRQQYHGDGINVFKVSAQGMITLHSLLKDDETLRLKGATRIETLQVDDKEALVLIATRDDEAIQICSIEEDGILRPISSIDLGYAVYNGMHVKKINGNALILVGAYDKNMLESYALDFK